MTEKPSRWCFPPRLPRSSTETLSCCTAACAALIRPHTCFHAPAGGDFVRIFTGTDGALHGRKLQLSPIAGTRRRGRDDEEDAALAADLLKDPKECSEHVMLVDLGRNDLGRVAKPGSVKLERLMEIERFPM